MKEIIRTRKLSKTYGHEEALKAVDLVIRQGEIFGLVGNNGAGKTTLLKILSGQGILSSGDFEMFGSSNEKDLLNSRKRMGCLVESPSFFPMMTVKQNLEYYRIQRGIPDKNKVEEALRDVNLLGAKNKKFRDLSLGMKQRLAIALALMGEPELLLLDEPINGLDPSGIIEIRKLLKRLNKDKKMTILISSHLLSELSTLATTYGFLHKGKMVQQIHADKLHEYCRSYLELKVTNIKRLTALIEIELGYKDYKVLQDNVLQIYDSNRQAEKVNELAWSNGIGVLELKEESINLEKYYIQLIGGHESA